MRTADGGTTGLGRWRLVKGCGSTGMLDNMEDVDRFRFVVLCLDSASFGCAVGGGGGLEEGVHGLTSFLGIG